MPTMKELLSDANEAVPRVTAEEAQELVSGRDALLLDVRDATELSSSGKLKGALNVSRGMLEFRADSEASYHDPEMRRRATGCPLLRVWRPLRARGQDTPGHGLH